eukprot:1139847-Pelagomonas_calceolata.AAC.11
MQLKVSAGRGMLLGRIYEWSNSQRAKGQNNLSFCQKGTFKGILMSRDSPLHSREMGSQAHKPATIYTVPGNGTMSMCRGIKGASGHKGMIPHQRPCNSLKSTLCGSCKNMPRLAPLNSAVLRSKFADQKHATSECQQI